MSWDVFVMRLPDNIRSMAEIPDDYKPQPLGNRSDLVAAIKEVAPTADFSDPSWGQINGDGFSIEVNIGEDEEVDSLALHVRGGDLAVGLIADLVDRLGVGAFDPQSENGIFDRYASIESLRRWRAYRDQTIGNSQAP